MTLILLSFIAFSTPTFAEDLACEKVDLSPQFPKIRNQGNSGWCFAFAAADLLSFYEGTNISALDVVILHNEVREPEALGLSQEELMRKNGWAAHALDRALKEGFCTEGETPSELNDKDLSQFLFQLEHSKTQNIPGEELKVDIKEVFKQTPQTLLKIYETSSKFDLVRNLAKSNCKRRPFTKISGARKIYWQEQGRNHGDIVLPQIQKMLDRKLPVIINYDSSGLLPLLPGNPIRAHYSLVVGRRQNLSTGACEYKIRNSWGSKNQGYRSSIESINGYQWVTEAFLKENLFETVFIE